MTEKVFVTGAGMISAIGVGLDETLNSLITGKSGIEKIVHLNTEHKDLPVGEVKCSNAKLSQILGTGFPESELRTVLLGIMAAREAVSNARLTEELIKNSIFISGTTVGGMDLTEKYFGKVLKDPESINDVHKLKYNDCGYSSSMIADAIGKFRMVTTPSTACSSAANAIILGAELIKSGLADIVVAGGTEALTVFHLNGFNSLMILDKSRCRPFDQDREGINLGEGAAYLVLESESSMMRRQAQPYAELKGYANSCDAFHQTASSENGEGAYLSMTQAMKMAGLQPSDIDYINAHGTGTQNNDETELKAMKRIWGQNLPPFSSTKAMTGHATSAAGALEAVISILALNNSFMPANLGWQKEMEEGIRPIVRVTKNKDIKNIITNSFGFGGNDSTLIFSKVQ